MFCNESLRGIDNYLVFRRSTLAFPLFVAHDRVSVFPSSRWRVKQRPGEGTARRKLRPRSRDSPDTPLLHTAEAAD